MSLPPKNPSLPQNDSPAEQQVRAAQISAAREAYEWTKSVATLPGVPLAANVPEDQEPTLEWSLMLVGVLLEIVRNAIAVKLTSVDKGVLGAASMNEASTRCEAIAAAASRISVHHHVVSGGNIFARGLHAIENAIEATAAAMHLAELKAHMCELHTIMEMTDNELRGTGASGQPSFEAYCALFDTLSLPGIAYTFQEDDEFARLRVAGPNPVLIKNIVALPDHFQLSDAQYGAVINGDTRAHELPLSR